MGWIIFIIVIVAAYLVYRVMPKLKPIDVSILPQQFIVIDVETKGLDPDTHKIIEIGAIKVNRDSIHHEAFQALVKIDGKLPKRISEITGITADMLDKDGQLLESTIKEFLQFIGEHRLVAYNAPFDLAFLSAAACQFNMKIENPVSCALDMSRRAWPRLKSYKLETLSKTGGLTTQGNHRTLKDCELTTTVYMSAAAKLKSVE
jgi:DNA polymerase III epsilon subunit family exonuclease